MIRPTFWTDGHYQDSHQVLCLQGIQYSTITDLCASFDFENSRDRYLSCFQDLRIAIRNSNLTEVHEAGQGLHGLRASPALISGKLSLISWRSTLADLSNNIKYVRSECSGPPFPTALGPCSYRRTWQYTWLDSRHPRFGWITTWVLYLPRQYWIPWHSTSCSSRRWYSLHCSRYNQLHGCSTSKADGRWLDDCEWGLRFSQCPVVEQCGRKTWWPAGVCNLVKLRLQLRWKVYRNTLFSPAPISTPLAMLIGEALRDWDLETAQV